MNPDDFLMLALRLSGAAGEAERRSAVSRAYYGVFHVARLLIEECGVACPESAEAHDKVAKCLQNGGNAEVAEAGKALNSLRTMRTMPITGWTTTDSRMASSFKSNWESRVIYTPG